MNAVRVALAVIAMVLGCGESGPGKPPQLLSNLQGAGSPPTLSWRDGAFVTTALPAVGRSAEAVVLALRDNDTGRGFPNLRLEVRDRNDKPIQSAEILNSNEYETLAPAGVATTALSARIAGANAHLARLHATHRLNPMAPLELQPSNDDRDPHSASGDGLRVDWRGDRLEVFAANGNRPVASADGRGWLAPPHPSCASCTPCENPAFLGAIYHASGINVVVAQIRYRGTDACWEPSDQFHVVAW